MDKDALSKQIIKWVCDNYEDEILLANGFETAFIGAGMQYNSLCAIYDKNKCIESLIEQGMTSEEAYEYFDFNVQGAYVGENTPIFIERFRR